MKNIPQRGEKGFTLIEILIALALLAIIGAVVIPNITGYIGRGETQAYNADQQLIQSAVNGFYADPANRITGKKAYPLLGAGTTAQSNAQKESGGTPTYASGAYTGTPSTQGFLIDFGALLTGKYITAAPASSSSENGSGASGSYSWYVDTSGIVKSLYTGDHSTIGFVSGVYP